MNSRPAAANFALQEGERVLLVGNSLFENDLSYGYLELALTTHWPGRNATFRNIGWTGDTVWGEARSYFTNPPTPYELLLKQITDARPTLVFVAYGGIEAQAGEEGYPHFAKGMNALLDTIQRLGARAVLLSPIPAFSGTSPDLIQTQNTRLASYSQGVAQIAAERNLRFIDVFNPLLEISKTTAVSDNGFHLNANGYFHLAGILLNALGVTTQPVVHTLTASKEGTFSSATAQIRNIRPGTPALRFTLDAGPLPLPVVQPTSESQASPLLKIVGLKKGYYTLTADGKQIHTASAQAWEKGVAVTQGPLYSQAEALRELIVKKNEIFFHQYRPHNRTYILGFRSYEQGRHAEDLRELGLIITWLEGQIALRRTPVAPVYELNKID